jgi:hypothetical protein
MASSAAPGAARSCARAAGATSIVLEHSRGASVSFRAVDASTGSPIEEFEVQSGFDWASPLMDETGVPKTQHPGGVVLLDGLWPAGDGQAMQLQLEGPGYAPLRREDIRVRSGQDLDLGDVRLMPQPVVTVHVEGPDGAPVAGADVVLLEEMPADEAPPSVGVRRTVSVTAGATGNQAARQRCTTGSNVRAKGGAPGRATRKGLRA